MRDRLSLNGLWDFAPTPGAEYMTSTQPPEPADLRRIPVPSCLQAEFDDLVDYADVTYYARTFSVPTAWDGRSVRLHFGAADYLAEVWVDGQYVGKHEGMFLPFAFDITHLVTPGHEQRLVVRVTDTGGSALPEKQYRQFPEISFKEAPHGKQSWYGPIGGLWQEVWLEAGSPVYIYRTLATPDVDGQQAHFRVILAGPLGPLSPKAAPTYTVLADTTPDVEVSHTLAAMVRVTAPDSTTYGPVAALVADGEARVTVALPEPMLWDLDSPYLYEFEVTLLDDEEVIDQTQDHFGMRTVEARENRIYLNGRPLYIRAALDQDYYPTTLWTPPSDEFLKEQVILAKELGLNMLRCHIKAPHPRYLYWADKLGLLVWEEYGNFSHLEGRAGDLGRATLEGMIERDFNRPSNIIWSIINESWGLNLSREKDRNWLLTQYPHFKAYDPTRLVVDNSACPGNFHMVSDLADYHSYYAYPDHFDQWENWVKDLASRPAWLFSPHGDAVITGQEPLMNSEFGNWGLPDAHDLLDADGKEPWWFATGDTWSWGIVHPAKVRERYAASILPATFGTYRDFVAATQVQQFRAFKHEIEAMRQQEQLNGYVITEFTDIHWECNGLVNQNRQPKAGHSLYQQIIAGTQLIARPVGGRWSFFPGDEMRIRVQVASDSPASESRYQVRWWLETGVRTPLPAPGAVPGPNSLQGLLPDVTLPGFGVSDAGELAFVAPAASDRLRLHLVLLDPQGREMARGHEDFAVFEQPFASIGGVASASLWLQGGLHHLAEPLSGMGYTAVTGGQPLSGQILVASKLDADAERFARSGGKVLLIASGRDALPWAPSTEKWDEAPESGPIRIVERKETRWQGDWASGWHWLRPDLLPAEAQAALENPLDLPWAGVLPEHMILGYGAAEQQDWLAGYTLGWIQAPAATAAAFRLGEGSVLVTTFRLAENLVFHPAAQTLLAGLVTRLSAPSFRPGKSFGV